MPGHEPLVISRTLYSHSLGRAKRTTRLCKERKKGMNAFFVPLLQFLVAIDSYIILKREKAGALCPLN